MRQTYVAHCRDRRVHGSSSPFVHIAAQSLVLMQVATTGFRCGTAHIGDRHTKMVSFVGTQPNTTHESHTRKPGQKSCWEATSKAPSGSCPLRNNSLRRNGLLTRVATRTSLFSQSFDCGEMAAQPSTRPPGPGRIRAVKGVFHSKFGEAPAQHGFCAAVDRPNFGLPLRNRQ